MDLLTMPREHSRHYNDDVDVPGAREESKLRLKSKLEDVISKYSKDFTHVGDEIDMETGEIVVDNGHLKKMRHEADAGILRSSLRTGADHAGDSDSDDELFSPSRSVSSVAALRHEPSKSRLNNYVPATPAPKNQEGTMITPADTIASNVVPRCIPDAPQWNPNDPAMIRALGESIARELGKVLRTHPGHSPSDSGPSIDENSSHAEARQHWIAPPLPPRPSYLLATPPLQNTGASPRERRSVGYYCHPSQSNSFRAKVNAIRRPSKSPFESVWAESTRSSPKPVPKWLPWTEWEHKTITNLRRDGHTAEQIASHLPNRTWRSIADKLTLLGVKPSRHRSSSNIVAIGGRSTQDAERKLSRGPWGPENTQRFNNLMDRGYRWEEMVPHFPERTAKAVRQRFYESRRIHARQSWSVPNTEETMQTDAVQPADEGPAQDSFVKISTKRQPWKHKAGADPNWFWSEADTSLLWDIVVNKRLHWRTAISTLPHKSTKSLKAKTRRLRALHDEQFGAESPPRRETAELLPIEMPERHPISDSSWGEAQQLAEIPELSQGYSDVALPAKSFTATEPQAAQYVLTTEQRRRLHAGHKQVRWTEAEEAWLCETVNKQNFCWSVVSEVFPHRSLGSLQMKWHALSSAYRAQPNKSSSDGSGQAAFGGHGLRKRAPPPSELVETRERKRERHSSVEDIRATPIRTNGVVEADMAAAGSHGNSLAVEKSHVGENLDIAASRSHYVPPCRQVESDGEKPPTAAYTTSLRSAPAAKFRPLVVIPSRPDSVDTSTHTAETGNAAHGKPEPSDLGRKKQEVRGGVQVAGAIRQASIVSTTTPRIPSLHGPGNVDLLDDGSEDELA